MRAHLAQEIVYSVYRLILIENRELFPCNRRLEETVAKCKKRPADILERGAAFLREVTITNCEDFVTAFWEQTALPLTDDVSENCSQYVKYNEDWWREDAPALPQRVVSEKTPLSHKEKAVGTNVPTACFAKIYLVSSVLTTSLPS